MREAYENDVLCCMPPQIAMKVKKAGSGKIEEIRLRLGMPLAVVISGESFMLGDDGIISDLKKAYCVTKEDIDCCVLNITKGSYYSFEDEIKNGFVTIGGGHRVGIGGRGVTYDGRLENISEISSLSFRIARQIKSCGDEAVGFIRKMTGLSSALVISPPGCGKTTLLREIARKLSNSGIRVTVIDERYELCAASEGKSFYDIGTSTDIYSGIKKAEAIPMAVRCLSPQVIICDELGTAEDFESVFYASSCGVAAIASVHGADLGDIVKKIGKDRLLACFEKFIVLDSGKRIKQMGRTEEIT